MARIRSIKPESLQHRKLGRVGHFDFRLWVGLLTQADDQGRGVADPGQFRLLVFGFHPEVTSADVQCGLERLAGTGLIRLYRVSDTQYVDFPSWKEHQKISHPTPSKLPPYKAALAVAISGTLQSPPESSGTLQSVPESPRARARIRSDRSDQIRSEGSEAPESAGNGLPAWVAALPFPPQPATVWTRLFSLFPGLDHEAVARDAIAYWVDHRKKYRDLPAFLRNQFSRAYTRQRAEGGARDPYANLPCAWECPTCGGVHEGPRDGPRPPCPEAKPHG